MFKRCIIHLKSIFGQNLTFLVVNLGSQDVQQMKNEKKLQEKNLPDIQNGVICPATF